MHVHLGSGLFILFMQVKGCIQITADLEWRFLPEPCSIFSAPRFTQSCFHTQRACASMLSKPVSWCGHGRQCGASFSNELIQTRTRDSFAELRAWGGWWGRAWTSCTCHVFLDTLTSCSSRSALFTLRGCFCLYSKLLLPGRNPEQNPAVICERDSSTWGKKS